MSKKVNGGGDDNLRNEKCNDDIVAGDFQQQEQQNQTLKHWVHPSRMNKL